MESEGQFIALVDQLDYKIRLLKGMYDATKQHVDRLEAEISTLRKTNREQETKLKELQKKLANSEKNIPKSKDFGKIVQNNLSLTDTNAELKQQLDEYIRDLERCIAHLSSLS